MAFVDDVRAVYEYLTTRVLPGTGQPTVTYLQIEEDTGVPMGEYGGYIGQVLGEISRRCNAGRLPPLTAIVVNGVDQIPGPGYFVEMAQTVERGNLAGWRIDPGIERWIQRPAPPGFDKRDDRWSYRDMIREHQQSVWRQQVWPARV